MAREFIVPGRIISGAGALDAAGAALKEMGKKALVVTDKVMVQLGNCARLEAALAGQGIGCVVYDEITGEPTDTMIENGLKIYQENGCDFLVALGGGSPIDSMKAIASLVKNGGSISDYMGKIIDVPVPPMAAIPTTAGTGSEATQFTIITDTKKDIKMLLKGGRSDAEACGHRSSVHHDRASQNHRGNRSGCPVPCNRSIYLQEGPDAVGYLCTLRGKTYF